MYWNYSWNHLPGTAAELNVKIRSHIVEFISIYCNYKIQDFDPRMRGL